MAFLAIDGSTKSTGYAVFEDGKLINYGHKTAASTDLIRRIMVMRECIRELLTNYKVDTVIMEEVRPDRGASNPITMKALMWLQAAFVFMIHDDFPKVKIIYTYPSEWRAACGIHTGPRIKREELKAADIKFASETYGSISNDDEADAICIGHAYLQKQSKELNWG